MRSTSKIADIFITRNEIFLVFTEKKVNFLFIFFLFRGKRNFFHCHFSLILLGSARLVGIILGANVVCT